MTLGFLTPACEDDSPPSESPMATAALRAGGRLEIRSGWRVPATFGDEDAERRAARESVAFADASWLPKTQLNGPPEVLAPSAGGLTLTTATAHGGAWWCPLTPTRALVIGNPPAAEAVDGLHALDVTSQYCALRIAGPRCREVMARFCALDLRLAVAPPAALRPGSVARTPGLVVVEDAAQLLVLVGAALAEYLWTVVADAVQRLGGRPAGSDVLQSGALARLKAGIDA